MTAGAGDERDVLVTLYPHLESGVHDGVNVKT